MEIKQEYETSIQIIENDSKINWDLFILISGGVLIVLILLCLFCCIRKKKGKRTKLDKNKASNQSLQEVSNSSYVYNENQSYENDSLHDSKERYSRPLMSMGQTQIESYKYAPFKSSHASEASSLA